MVYKQIRTKKTNSGYSIMVFVKDGELAGALRVGIERFFAKVEEDFGPNRRLEIEKEVNHETEQIKAGTSIKDAH